MSFSLPTFLPYLLNQAAETVSHDFQRHYKSRYGMLRTEWRVLFHLGCYGDLTAKRICDMARLHKTKVSRAVRALEDKRFLTKRTDEVDRRVEHLSLTSLGQKVFTELSKAAETYEAQMVQTLSHDELLTLRRALIKLTNPSATG
ncbi:MAG: MarR family winged helix-turn-helix transcriptional regulator [Pseudomonadota bacterium]